MSFCSAFHSTFSRVKKYLRFSSRLVCKLGRKGANDFSLLELSSTVLSIQIISCQCLEVKLLNKNYPWIWSEIVLQTLVQWFEGTVYCICHFWVTYPCWFFSSLWTHLSFLYWFHILHVTKYEWHAVVTVMITGNIMGNKSRWKTWGCTRDGSTYKDHQESLLQVLHLQIYVTSII